MEDGEMKNERLEKGGKKEKLRKGEVHVSVQ